MGGYIAHTKSLHKFLPTCVHYVDLVGMYVCLLVVPVSLSVNIGMLVFVVGLMVISMLSKPSGGRERERGGGGRGREGERGWRGEVGGERGWRGEVGRERWWRGEVGRERGRWRDGVPKLIYYTLEIWFTV